MLRINLVIDELGLEAFLRRQGKSERIRHKKIKEQEKEETIILLNCFDNARTTQKKEVILVKSRSSFGDPRKIENHRRGFALKVGVLPLH